MKRQIYLSASILALTAVLPAASALAQTQEKTDATKTTKGDGIVEVVVTATKRATNLQKVPMVVDVIGRDELAKASLSEMSQIQTLVPGLNIQQAGTLSQYYIRGVGGTVTGPADQPGISLNIDGAYSQSPVAGHVSFYDINHIEVLKGPQGTLFGRNATGGAINLTTNNPTFKNGFSVAADLGTYGRKKLEAVANYAIDDKVALRFAAMSAEHDGYYKDGLDDEDNYGFRGKLLYKPNERLTVLFSADYAVEGGKGSAMMPVDDSGHTLTSDSRAGPTDPIVTTFAETGVAPIYGWKAGDFNKYAHQNNKTHGVNLQVDYDLGPVNLTFLTANHTTALDTVSYLSGFALAQNYETKEDATELRLSSKNTGGRFSYVGGLYFYNAKVTGDILTVLGTTGSPILSARSGGFDPALILTGSHSFDTDNSMRDHAVFGQGQYQITSKLRFTLGARYLEEHQVRQGTTQLISFGVLGPETVSRAQKDYSRTIWRTGFDYTPSQQSTIYAYASSGWKSGDLMNYDSPYNNYKPESLTAYSLGTKNRLLNNRLQLNGEIFYWNYLNRQVLTFAVVENGGVATRAQVTVNAARSHIQGAEFDAAYRLTSVDTFGFAVEYIDQAVNDSFTLPSATPQNGCTLISGQLYDCSGSNMQQEPKFSGNISYEHEFEFKNGSRVSASIRSKFQSKSDITQSPTSAAGIQDAYTMTNLNVTYVEPHGRWSIGAYVNNVENSLVRVSSTGSPVTGTAWVTQLAPRTSGIQLKYMY